MKSGLMENGNPVYLGDGVYASFDGYQIELRVNDHRNEPVVYLESNVMLELMAYANKIFNLDQEHIET